MAKLFLVKMRSRYLHLLSLIYTGKSSELYTFLADVENVKRLRGRALRLGGWRYLNDLERSIINLTVRTLTRVRSRLLLDSLVRIFMKILPHLLSGFERRLMENMERIRETLGRLGEEARDLLLKKLSRSQEYLYTEALKLTIAENNFIGIVYNI